MMAGRLQDRVALITGGGSGMGRAAAIRFAEEGAPVAVVDVIEEAARETAGLVEAAGGTALPLRADVTVEADVQRVVAATLDRFGRVDVLLANAGIEGPVTFIAEVSEDEWDRVMAVNVKGVFLAVKHCIPPMQRQGGGSIVITASNSGLVAFPNLAPYCASKGASLMFTKALAVDLAPHNIRVNAVCPGNVDTPMLRRAVSGWSGGAEETLKSLGRLASAREVANLMLFLASDEAAHMTGSAVVIDYGETASPGPVWPSPRYYT